MPSSNHYLAKAASLVAALVHPAQVFGALPSHDPDPADAYCPPGGSCCPSRRLIVRSDADVPPRPSNVRTPLLDGGGPLGAGQTRFSSTGESSSPAKIARRGYTATGRGAAPASTARQESSSSWNGPPQETTTGGWIRGAEDVDTPMSAIQTAAFAAIFPEFFPRALDLTRLGDTGGTTCDC